MRHTPVAQTLSRFIGRIVAGPGEAINSEKKVDDEEPKSFSVRYHWHQTKRTRSRSWSGECGSFLESLLPESSRRGRRFRASSLALAQQPGGPWSKSLAGTPATA